MDKRPSARMAAGKRDWGHGNATAGRDKVIDWIPQTHFGPIRGVEVGMTYEYRHQVSFFLVIKSHALAIVDGVIVDNMSDARNPKMGIVRYSAKIYK